MALINVYPAFAAGTEMHRRIMTKTPTELLTAEMPSLSLFGRGSTSTVPIWIKIDKYHGTHYGSCLPNSKDCVIEIPQECAWVCAEILTEVLSSHARYTVDRKVKAVRAVASPCAYNDIE